jgi:hypothetical protein
LDVFSESVALKISQMKKKLNILNNKYWLFVWGILAAFSSCQKVEIDKSVEEILSAKPMVESFSPSSSPVMGLVTVKGENLNFVKTAYIGSTACDIYRKINSGELVLRVPAAAKNGAIRLVTSAGNEVVTTQELSVSYPTPVVSSSVPNTALVNANLVIEGSNLDVVSKVMFGTHEAIVEFKEASAIIVKVPFSKDANNDLSFYYFKDGVESSMVIKAGFVIDIPMPKAGSWPTFLKQGQSVIVNGANMNLVESVKFGSTTITNFTATAESLEFSLPSTIATGKYTITLSYDGGTSTVVSPEIVYVGVKLEVYCDFDTEPITYIDKKSDYLTTLQINGTVPQPPVPGSQSYAHLIMNTGTTLSSSSLAVFRFYYATNLTYLDLAGNFTDPVLHFWVNTNNTTPTIQIEYVSGTKKANRAINTGTEWKLMAIHLRTLFPTGEPTNYFRLNLQSYKQDVPCELNLDWVVISEGVLTGLGAVDATADFAY